MEAGQEQKNWHHPLDFENVRCNPPRDVDRQDLVRVGTLNVLADAYCNPQQLPWVERKHLGWQYRRYSIIAAIRALRCDILALQEVDQPDDIIEELQSLGYDAVFAQRPGRRDGVLTAWQQKKFARVWFVGRANSPGTDVVDFNDLVALQGGDERFRRSNLGLLMALRDLTAPGSRLLLVANAHLYWNPHRKDVKLAQAVYLTRRIEGTLAELRKHFTTGTKSAAAPCLLEETRTKRFTVFESSSQNAHSCCNAVGVIVCGDLNSIPSSAVAAFFTSPTGIARPSDRTHDRFLCDSSLNRLTRWLRLLGIDTELETAAEEAKRTSTQNDCSQLFARCVSEKRLLLTSSRKVLQRSECPPAVFVDNRNARESFAALVKKLRIPVQPSTFLTRCVKCNGVIKAEESGEWPEGWDGNRARLNDGVPDDLPLFMCTNPACTQVYWFSNRPNSSAVRSKELADELFALVKPNNQNAALEQASSNEEMNDKPHETPELVCSASTAPRDAVGVLAGQHESSQNRQNPETSTINSAETSSVRLRHSLRLRSAYHTISRVEGGKNQSDHTENEMGNSKQDNHSIEDNEIITTSRADFHGYLDYLLFSDETFRGCSQRLKLPSARQLRDNDVLGKLPCRTWGSDHLFAVADLLWREMGGQAASESEPRTGAAD